LIKAKISYSTEHRPDVAMRKGADNLPRALRGEGLTTQSAPNEIDEIGREMGEVAKGLVLNPSILAVCSAQEMGLVDLSFIGLSRRGYMNWTISPWHMGIIPYVLGNVKRLFDIFVATICNLIFSLTA